MHGKIWHVPGFWRQSSENMNMYSTWLCYDIQGLYLQMCRGNNVYVCVSHAYTEPVFVQKAKQYHKPKVFYPNFKGRRHDTNSTCPKGVIGVIKYGSLLCMAAMFYLLPHLHTMHALYKSAQKHLKDIVPSAGKLRIRTLVHCTGQD